MKTLRILFLFSVILLCPVPGAQPPEVSAKKTAQTENDSRQVSYPSSQTEDLAAQARELLALSESQNYGDHARALEIAQQALALWQTLADNSGMARAYAQIGRCYFARSDLPEAIENYEIALQLWRDLHNPREQAGILTMLGFIDARKGEWPSSIAFLTEAQGLVEEEDEPGNMGQIASGLAYIFSESGLPENGLVQYRRALDYYRRTPDTRDDTLTILAIGATYYFLSNYSEASAHLHQALASVAPDGIDAALCMLYLGRVHISTGELPIALQYLQSALAIYTRIGNPNEAAQALGLIGQIHQQQGKLKNARQNYRQALATFRKLSDRINQAAIYYALGRLELKSGNYDAAEDYLRQSIEVTENIRRVSTSHDLTAAFTASVYERYESYIDCLMRKHQAEPAEGFAVRAFEASELARGRSLAELLRATETNLMPGIDPQLAAQEKALRQSLRVKENHKVALLGKACEKEELDALEVELARLEGEYKRVSETIQARHPSYEQITRPTVWDLRQIQEQVIADDQTVILEYILGADRSYVWAVTRDSIKSYTLPARALVDEAAQKIYKLTAIAPGPNTAKELTLAAQELARMILSPVAAELSKSRIIIVGDGALHYIPFQMLPSPSAGNEPLVASHEIINVPSASILGELRKEATRRQRSKLLAVFGAPEFEPSHTLRADTPGSGQSLTMQALENARWRQALRDIELSGDSFDPSAIKSLFYAERELANLRKAASDGEIFVASGYAATREQLLSTDLTQYAILHFATHGMLDPRRPEKSGLILSTVTPDGKARDGFVGLQDIYGLRAPVDLVVLSACRTALGKDVRGEGLLGLTRGFMYAGASSVIASLWRVDDEATAELMRESYANMLQKGMTPAAALRQAQNSIRQRPEWQAPYYWAGFTLQGEYRQVIKPASARLSWKIIIIGALMLSMLLVGAALFYRHRRARTPRESNYSTVK